MLNVEDPAACARRSDHTSGIYTWSTCARRMYICIRIHMWISTYVHRYECCVGDPQNTERRTVSNDKPCGMGNDHCRALMLHYRRGACMHIIMLEQAIM